MCEQLGSTPIDEEVPVDIADLPIEAIQAWQIYERLPSNIDTFSGTYLGKSIEHTPVILDLMDISIDRLVLLYIIGIVDRIEKEQINAKMEQQRSSKKKG
jgi:hypothetical protein